MDIQRVSITNLIDVTIDQSITSIASNLLVKSVDTFDKIQWGIRKMLGHADFSIGILVMQDGKLCTLNREGSHSILLKNKETVDCRTEMCSESATKLLGRTESLIIPDTVHYHQIKQTSFSNRLINSDSKKLYTHSH